MAAEQKQSQQSEAIEIIGVEMPVGVLFYTGSAATNALSVGNRIQKAGVEKGSDIDGIIERFTLLPSGSMLIHVGAGSFGGKAGRLLLTTSGMLCIVKSETKDAQQGRL